MVMVNEKTIGDVYLLPNIMELLHHLGSAKYFSLFDLASGFHQTPMHESDTQITAFFINARALSFQSFQCHSD